MSHLDPLRASDVGTSGADAGGTATVAQLGCDMLFAASREPILIIDAASGSISEANPAALDLLRASHSQLIGAPLKSALDPQSGAIIDTGFAMAQLRGGTHALEALARDGQTLCVRVSVFHTSEKSFFLMRLASSDARPGSSMFQLIDEAPVGFLLTDVNLHIDYANRSFMAMIDVASQADLRGKSLARWLDLSQAELAALQMQLCQGQAVTRLESSLRCTRHGARHVEVHAIAVPDDQTPCWGFSVNLLRLLN